MDDVWKGIDFEQARDLLFEWMRNPNHGKYSSYGYEIYLPNLAAAYLERERDISDTLKCFDIFNEYSAVFYDAAWELCRRGILRPGLKNSGGQATPDGASGNGFSITEFGKQWLREDEHANFVPTEPEKFAKMIDDYVELFGMGFKQRANEAIRCYGAHAYLACCVMCGAAAESILLTIAIEKEGEEGKVLKEYKSSRGRSKIENKIIGKLSKNIKSQFSSVNDLLKYWRDTSAHGCKSDLNEVQAFTSLALMLRLSAFVKDNYDVLTSNG